MEQATNNTNQNHDSVLRAARALWRRQKWLAIFVFLAPFSVTVSLAMAMPNLYRATATVLIKQQLVSGAMAASPAAGELESRLQAINEEILSRSRLQELITRFNLYPRLRQHATSEEVIERMRRDIRLERKEVALRWGYGSTVAFTLSYQGWEPETVARVANTLASFYVEENERLRPHQTGNTDVLAQLKKKLAEQRTQFNERYPDIVRLKAEIAALERERRMTAPPRAGESPLSTQTPDSTAVRQQPEAPGNQTAETSQRQRGEQFRILDPAIPPDESIAPNRIRFVLMGLVLALGMAVAVALLAEQLDTSFHRLDELWAFTRLPILANIPRIVTRADTWRRRLRFAVISSLALSGLAFLGHIFYHFGQSAEQLVWLLVQRGA